MNVDRSTNQTNAKLYFNRSGTNLNQSTENFPRNANNPNPNRSDRSAFSGEVRSPEPFKMDQGGRGENCRTDEDVDQSDGIGVMSYEDFLKSVGSRGIPLLRRGRHHHSQYDHHIPRHSRHGHRHGYESDTGYRSDAVGLRSHGRRHGYESDAGYRSEAGYYSYADRYNNNRSMLETARSCYPVIEMGGSEQATRHGGISFERGRRSTLRWNERTRSSFESIARSPFHQSTFCPIVQIEMRGAVGGAGYRIRLRSATISAEKRHPSHSSETERSAETTSATGFARSWRGWIEKRRARDASVPKARVGEEGSVAGNYVCRWCERFEFLKKFDRSRGVCVAGLLAWIWWKLLFPDFSRLLFLKISKGSMDRSRGWCGLPGELPQSLSYVGLG